MRTVVVSPLTKGDKVVVVVTSPGYPTVVVSKPPVENAVEGDAAPEHPDPPSNTGAARNQGASSRLGRSNGDCQRSENADDSGGEAWRKSARRWGPADGLGDGICDGLQGSRRERGINGGVDCCRSGRWRLRARSLGGRRCFSASGQSGGADQQRHFVPSHGVGAASNDRGSGKRHHGRLATRARRVGANVGDILWQGPDSQGEKRCQPEGVHGFNRLEKAAEMCGNKVSVDLVCRLKTEIQRLSFVLGGQGRSLGWHLIVRQK
ncbi:hypothetical protein IWX49DRAFT_346990 [Phyllosticta citricarpa]